MVQPLGLGSPISEIQAQPLGEAPRLCKPHSREEREKEKNIKQKSKDRKISKRNDKGKPNINTKKDTHAKKEEK